MEGRDRDEGGNVEFYKTHLIMTPGQHDVVQPAVGLIDTIIRRIQGIVKIGVVLKCFRVYDLVRELAANYKSVL